MTMNDAHLCRLLLLELGDSKDGAINMSIIVDKYLDTSEKRKEAKGGSAGKKSECFSIALSGRLILVKYLQKHVIY